MKVILTATKEVQDIPEEYAARLYEQGKVVFPEKKPAKPEKPEAKPEEKQEKPKGKKG